MQSSENVTFSLNDDMWVLSLGSKTSIRMPIKGTAVFDEEEGVEITWDQSDGPEYVFSLSLKGTQLVLETRIWGMLARTHMSVTEKQKKQFMTAVERFLCFRSE